eukprot:13514314-Alexandrium_andersonii.AAC.1
MPAEGVDEVHDVSDTKPPGGPNRGLERAARSSGANQSEVQRIALQELGSMHPTGAMQLGSGAVAPDSEAPQSGLGSSVIRGAREHCGSELESNAIRRSGAIRSGATGVRAQGN